MFFVVVFWCFFCFVLFLFCFELDEGSHVYLFFETESKILRGKKEEKNKL